MSWNDRNLELRRLRERPEDIDVPSLLAWRIETYGSLESFAYRLRKLIAAAVGISDFEGEQIDQSVLPAWFSTATGVQNDVIDIPTAVLAGIKRYSAVREEDAWDIQEWLYSFDPELRRWRWWDLTTSNGVVAYLWIDTKGESIFAGEELTWAVFAAGGKEVRPASRLLVDDWRVQSSIGL